MEIAAIVLLVVLGCLFPALDFVCYSDHIMDMSWMEEKDSALFTQSQMDLR